MVGGGGVGLSGGPFSFSFSVHDDPLQEEEEEEQN